MANRPVSGGGEVVVEDPGDVPERRDGAAFQEVPVVVALVGDALRAAPAAHEVDDAVHPSGGAGEGLRRARTSGRLARSHDQRSDAVAGFRGGGLDPCLVRAHGEDPEAGLAAARGPRRSRRVPLPPVTSTFRARRRSSGGHRRRRGPGRRHGSDAPVMPAVDSMTGRIFFSSAS